MDTAHDAGRLMQMVSGYWISQALYVAAKLEIADRLAAAPRASDELAAECQAHPGAVYRLLRTLASVGVFTETAPRHFGLTPLAQGLQRQVPGSQWAATIMMGEQHYQAWGEALYSVRTGAPAFDHVFGMPVFEYLTRHPEEGKIFDAAMTGIHGRETSAALDVCDLAGIGRLIDIGGGNGGLLTATLQRYPRLQATLFDLPAVAERARPRLEAAGLSDRCEVVGGNFFEAVPSGGDAYLLRHIIHDWDDERAGLILRNCRTAMTKEARLLLIETVIPPGDEPCFGKLLDLTMLIIPGGVERTADEYAVLLQSAGFKLTEIVPTTAEVSIITSRPR